MQRNDTDTAWIKYEPDGVTLHTDEKKFKSSQTFTAVQNLTKLVEELGTKVNSLRIEVAELRKEVLSARK